MADTERRRREELRRQREKELEEKRKRLDAVRRAREERKKRTEEKEPTVPVDDILAKVRAEREEAKEVAEQKAEEEREQLENRIREEHVSRLRAKLAVSLGVASTSVPPVIVDSYDKGVQTDVPSVEEDDEAGDTLAETAQAPPDDADATGPGSAATTADDTDAPQSAEHTAELTEEEKDRIQQQPSYQMSVLRASTLVERALNTPWDIMAEYAVDEDDVGQKSAAQLRVMLELQGRGPVLSLEWSPHHPELLLASHSAGGTTALEDSDGFVALWSMRTPHAPEITLTSTNAITTARFYPFSQSRVIGGDVAGRIVVWDTSRGDAAQHVSNPSLQGHAYPVTCLAFVGSSAAHSLFSMSSEGVCCGWDLRDVADPFVGPRTLSTNARPLGVSAGNEFGSDTGRIAVGCDDGVVACIMPRDEKTTVRSVCAPEGQHSGPVTAVACHPAPQQGDLFLTSSLDWSVRLWNKKDVSSPIIVFQDGTDYVFDVRWSPANSAVFATCSSGGVVSLWDISADHEVPILRETVCEGVALNRIAWSCDGKRIATGDVLGRIHILDVPPRVRQGGVAASEALAAALQAV